MRRALLPSAVALAAVLTASAGGVVAVSNRSAGPTAAGTASASPSATPAPSAEPLPSPASSPSATAAAVARPPLPQRRTYATGWRPFATAGPVTLRYPVDVVELVGLHESAHDGAQQLRPIKGAGRIGVLDSRERGTRSQGAADIVVSPTHAVRAPVTGRVLRAGSYTLYCDYRDNYVVIEPDARPGWEVKVLHFQGLAVAKGDRVRAGITVIGAHARKLPFASQVDEHTTAPHWPHVHVEVVDPSVHDRPSEPCD